MPVILPNSGTSANTYMKHATQHGWFNQDVKGMSNTQIMKELGNRLICRRCESVIPRHNGRNRGKCPKCGWEGETITLDEMLTQQLYRR